MGAAPVAAPMAAKAAILEASGASLGLGSLAGGAVLNNHHDATPQFTPISTGDYISVLKDRLAECLSPEYKLREFKDEVVTRLDPDIAAMRSISASAMIAIQKERNIDRYITRRARSISEEIEKMGKKKLQEALGF